MGFNLDNYNIYEVFLQIFARNVGVGACLSLRGIQVG